MKVFKSVCEWYDSPSGVFCRGAVVGAIVWNVMPGKPYPWLLTGVAVSMLLIGRLSRIEVRDRSELKQP